MRFEELLERQERGALSQLEASEMLGMSERTFRRWRDRLRDEGEEGLLDRRIGKPSPRRAPEIELARFARPSVVAPIAVSALGARWRGKGPHQASKALPRRFPGMACSVASTRTAAPTTSTRRRQGRRSERVFRTLRDRLVKALAPCGGPGPGSPKSRPPTASSPRSTRRSTTLVSRSSPSRTARPLSPVRPSSGASCRAGTRSARSATTTA